ncbi:MAG: hypothetical protein EBR34_13965 [Sphingomonadaceae bacterium]|nr:hypothetical protein [Sphingomonadaceae bacterium]
MSDPDFGFGRCWHRLLQTDFAGRFIAPQTDEPRVAQDTLLLVAFEAPADVWGAIRRIPVAVFK